MKTQFYLVTILSPHPKLKNLPHSTRRYIIKNPALLQKPMARRVNSCAIIALSTTFTSYFAFHKGTFDNSKSYTIQLKCSIVYVILSAFSHLISKGITKKIKQNDGDVKKDIYFCNATPTLWSWQA